MGARAFPDLDGSRLYKDARDDTGGAGDSGKMVPFGASRKPRFEFLGGSRIRREIPARAS